MTTTQTDLSAITQKNLYHFNDYRDHLPQDSSRIKKSYLQAHPMLDNEKRSFIVTWQLPEIENQDVDQSHS